MTDNNDEAKDILEQFDRLLAQVDWEKSRFLNATKKELCEIRDQFALRVKKTEKEVALAKHSVQSAMQSQAAERKKVFISLYNIDGVNLVKWERILINLPYQAVTRPTYASESEIKALIRSKANKRNEAYVVLTINENDIIIPAKDKIPHDRLGNELLILKDNVLHPEAIECFVHSSGRYKFSDNHLQRQEVNKASD